MPSSVEVEFRIYSWTRPPRNPTSTLVLSSSTLLNRLVIHTFNSLSSSLLCFLHRSLYSNVSSKQYGAVPLSPAKTPTISILWTKDSRVRLVLVRQCSVYSDGFPLFKLEFIVSGRRIRYFGRWTDGLYKLHPASILDSTSATASSPTATTQPGGHTTSTAIIAYHYSRTVYSSTFIQPDHPSLLSS